MLCGTPKGLGFISRRFSSVVCCCRWAWMEDVSSATHGCEHALQPSPHTMTAAMQWLPYRICNARISDGLRLAPWAARGGGMRLLWQTTDDRHSGATRATMLTLNQTCRTPPRCQQPSAKTISATRRPDASSPRPNPNLPRQPRTDSESNSVDLEPQRANSESNSAIRPFTCCRMSSRPPCAASCPAAARPPPRSCPPALGLYAGSRLGDTAARAAAAAAAAAPGLAGCCLAATPPPPLLLLRCGPPRSCMDLHLAAALPGRFCMLAMTEPRITS